jgi:hypothetical protein
MTDNDGYKISRLAEITWEDRKNVDGWPSRAGLYYDDRENELCMRLIDYPPGSIEPRRIARDNRAQGPRHRRRAYAESA